MVEKRKEKDNMTLFNTFVLSGAVFEISFLMSLPVDST